jgi:GntR family transcriptional regulator, transcriptional repressor for pyruvate dehydrogenase complex
MLEQAKETTVLGVVTHLLAFIQKRDYQPGERLPSERDLAERFSVGRGVIREAMASLEAVRYVERRRNSGVFLQKRASELSVETLVLYYELGIPLDARDIRDALEARHLLDVQAIQIACQRRTQEDLDALDSILTSSQVEIDNDRPIDRLDEDFHMAIFKATHNSVIVRLVRPFYFITRESRRLFFKNRENCLVSHAHHVKMAQYIASRDVPASAALMRAHIDRAASFHLNAELSAKPESVGGSLD